VNTFQSSSAITAFDAQQSRALAAQSRDEPAPYCLATRRSPAACRFPDAPSLHPKIRTSVRHRAFWYNRPRRHPAISFLNPDGGKSAPRIMTSWLPTTAAVRVEFNAQAPDVQPDLTAQRVGFSLKEPAGEMCSVVIMSPERPELWRFRKCL